ncbi:hypothetical protein [Pseudomonas oryziphila]|uniref:Uncharacterized protein n=1 Tax=Pseudomonas oryziphila TaxID=2894079 RepID=A0ABN5TEA5_9PSED|nr:hypothetical protein [Pseudomonas oryziphila]AZL72074.1 hypothetical protein EI693_02760 [Pseudomonas oryziphila]
MIFHSSSEQDISVGPGAQAARRKVAAVVSDLLSEVSLECGAETWSYISIMMPDDAIDGYPEVSRYHKQRSVIEVRVQLPFYEVKDADDVGKVEFMLDGLNRSIDLMVGIKSLKMSSADASVLRGVVTQAKDRLGVA